MLRNCQRLRIDVQPVHVQRPKDICDIVSALSTKAAFAWKIAEFGIPRTARKLRISDANQRYRARDPLGILGSITQNAESPSVEEAGDRLAGGPLARSPMTSSVRGYRHRHVVGDRGRDLGRFVVACA
jgi:hypothetical protein